MREGNKADVIERVIYIYIYNIYIYVCVCVCMRQGNKADWTDR